jgi:hypothetical protein
MSTCNNALSTDEYSMTPCRLRLPLSVEYGICRTAKARFGPWISGKSPQTCEGVPSLRGSGQKLASPGLRMSAGEPGPLSRVSSE